MSLFNAIHILLQSLNFFSSFFLPSKSGIQDDLSSVGNLDFLLDFCCA